MGGDFLGRIKLDESCLDDPETCAIDHYRVPKTFSSNALGNVGWSIDTAPDGSMVFSAQWEAILGRFDISEGAADSEFCKSEGGATNADNPCMSIVHVPLVDNPSPGVQLLHTMAVDQCRNLLWYTYNTGSSETRYQTFNLGYAPIGLSGGPEIVTQLPALYAFVLRANSGAGKFKGAGIFVGQDGEIFFTDLSRREFGRIKPIGPYMGQCP